jgi:hypothetical protein
MFASLFRVDTPSKCCAVSVLIFILLLVLALMTPLAPSAWERATPTEVKSGLFEIKAGPGMRGEVTYYKKVR